MRAYSLLSTISRAALKRVSDSAVIRLIFSCNAAFTFSSFSPGQINSHVHRRAVDAGAQGEQANADV